MNELELSDDAAQAVAAPTAAIDRAFPAEQSDRDLTASTERYRRFFAIATDWFWELDSQYRFTYVSPNILSATGLPASHYLGRRLSETAGVMIEPDMVQKALSAQRAKMPYGDFRYSRRLQDGKIIWLSASGSPIFGPGDEFLGYCGITRDITAQVESEQVLRKSEQQFRKLYEIYADYYWEQDDKHRVTFVAPESFHDDLFGVPVAHIYGKRISEFLGASIEPEMGAKVLLALKNRQPFRDVLYSIKHPNGRKRWVSLCGAPAFDADGKFRGYRGVGVEITRRVEAETVARLAQRQLHDAVAHVSQPFAVFDAEDRAIAFNQAFADLYRSATVNTPVRHGVTFRQLADWAIGTGFYAEGPEEERVDLETLLDHHQSDREHTYHLRDGRWMMVVYRHLPGDGRVGLWTDITAVKRAERALRRTRRHLEQAQRVAAIGSVYRDLATGSEEWSEQMYRVFGVDRDTFERTDTNTLALIHPEDRNRVGAGFNRAYAGLPTPPAEFRIVRPNGEVRVIYAEADFEQNAAGKPTHLLAVFRDVTELREAERREQEQRRHAQKLESLGTLAGGVAHDLNNTLVPILVLTKMLAKRLPEGSGERRDVLTIAGAGERARDLVKQILAFSRKEAPTRSIVDLAEVTREALRLLRASVPTMIKMVQNLGPVPPLLGDAGALHQVITNLVTNAAHAIGDKIGTITVEVVTCRGEEIADDQRPIGPATLLSVSDTGCGMDQATAARIFEPFFTTKAAGVGTGLGLSMVQGIVTQLGGRIAVDSRPGQGTRFDVYLPVFDADATASLSDIEQVE